MKGHVLACGAVHALDVRRDLLLGLVGHERELQRPLEEPAAKVVLQLVRAQADAHGDESPGKLDVHVAHQPRRLQVLARDVETPHVHVGLGALQVDGVHGVREAKGDGAVSLLSHGSIFPNPSYRCVFGARTKMSTKKEKCPREV